jgi:hypothetical protein
MFEILSLSGRASKARSDLVIKELEAKLRHVAYDYDQQIYALRKELDKADAMYARDITSLENQNKKLRKQLEEEKAKVVTHNHYHITHPAEEIFTAPLCGACDYHGYLCNGSTKKAFCLYKQFKQAGIRGRNRSV